MSVNDSEKTVPFSVRITRRQLKVLNIVARENGTEKTVLLRKLIDAHLEPIAVRAGLEEHSKEIGRTSMKNLVPQSFQRLTRSQLCCLVDMFLQGWLAKDLANLYGIKRDDIEELFGGKTEDEVCSLRSKLRRLVKREKTRWLQHGEN